VVDAEMSKREPPQTLERVPLQTGKEYAYVGVAATGRAENGIEFVLVCKSPEDCEALWDKFMQPTPLDLDGVQHVAIVKPETLQKPESA
jgi:hypothetical protein